MNQQERDQLGLKLTEVAMLFGKDFPKEQAKIYINSLLSFIPDNVENYINALNEYCCDSKNKFFPAPVGLRQYLRPEASIDSQANQIASKIRQAISEIGYVSSSRAKLFIGEIGWQVVLRSGGWKYLCENHGVDLNPLTFYAQSRDAAKSIIETNKISGFFSSSNILDYTGSSTDVELNDKKRIQSLALLESLKIKEIEK